MGSADQPANLEITKLLLEHGADPDKRRSDNGKTEFSDGANALILNITREAQSDGSSEIADLLFQKGARLNDQFIFAGDMDGLSGHSLLGFVVSQASLKWARWLLEHKASPNVANEHGSPLQIAEETGNSEMVALLKEFGAR